MPDQPSTPTAQRIASMLQDLAAQKTMPRPAPPANLPTQPPRPSSSPQPPTRPQLPRPPAGIAPPPRPSAPPPAPREAPVATVSVPRPPTPPPVAPKLAPPAQTPPPLTSGKPTPPVAISSELRTMAADIASMKTGQAPQGVKVPTRVLPADPSAPITPPRAPTAVAPSIAAPSSSGSGLSGSRKILYGVAGVLIFIGILYSIVSIFSGSEEPPIVSASPTPQRTATPSPTPVVRSLRSYFGNLGGIITLKDSSTAVADFRNGLLLIQPTRKLATVISLTKTGATLTSQSLMADVFATAPTTLTSTLGTDFLALAYGQSEQFSDVGIRTDLVTPTPKVVFIFEITNASSANQAMRAWESATLPTASAALFGYDAAKRLVAGFSEGIYRTIPVRYLNFPYADKSVDYAIVTASNNKNYLVISASRESIFFVIDQLMQ